MSRCEMAVKHLGCARDVVSGWRKEGDKMNAKDGAVFTRCTERHVGGPFVRLTLFRSAAYLHAKSKLYSV